MPPRTSNRPKNQHRFERTTPMEFCDPKLAEWVDWQRAAKLAESTATRRARRVDLFARERNVIPVTVPHGEIISWFAAHDDWSRSTAALYFEYLNSWFTWLQRMDYRLDNPMLKLLKPTRAVGEPRPVGDEDLIRLLSIRMYGRTRVMILLAALAGLRVSEVARVKGEDVDHGRSLLWVVGKGGKRRSIPLHPRLLAAAQEMPRKGWWFPGEYERTGQPVRSTSVSTIIGQAMRRAGVPGTPHALRHWFATALLASGADLRTVQELMRHASVATTQIYTRVPDDRRHEAVGALDPWAAARLVIFTDSTNATRGI